MNIGKKYFSSYIRLVLDFYHWCQISNENETKLLQGFTK